jgi:hypothetical protein
VSNSSVRYQITDLDSEHAKKIIHIRPTIWSNWRSKLEKLISSCTTIARTALALTMPGLRLNPATENDAHQRISDSETLTSAQIQPNLVLGYDPKQARAEHPKCAMLKDRERMELHKPKISELGHRVSRMS